MQPHSLPEDIDARLQTRARSTGRSLGEVTREAVLDEIAALERYYEQVSLRREFQRHRNGGSGA